MKTLKKIVLALCITASMGAVSTSVMAEEGRTTYEPTVAIDMVAAKTGVALEALEKGAEASEVDGLIIAILAASKEINASDKVFAKRDKVHSKLKAARKDLKEGNRQGAEQELRDAQKAFLALKEIL